MLSTIVILVLIFATLGLLLGFAASFDPPARDSKLLPTNIEDRDPSLQQKAFEDCIKKARFDGRLTDDEYFKCAYSIYG